MGWAKKYLSEAAREAIAKSLFPVIEELTSKGWLNGKCPLHEDENPSFGYHVIDDVFHCHAACTPDGDLVDLFCLVKGLDRKAGFLEFKKLYGGGQEQILPPAAAQQNKQGGGNGEGKTAGNTAAKEQGPTKTNDNAATYEVDVVQMHEAYKKFVDLPEAWLKRLESERGWSRSVIRNLGIKLQTHYWDKKTGKIKLVSKKYARIAIPIFGPDGDLVNIRLYNPDGGDNKIISFGPGVGKNRLFPCPAPKESGLVYLCEGESDTICARSLGLNAYTQTSKRKNWPEDQVRPFRGCDVVIAYDADKPGQEYAKSAANSLLGSAESIRVIDWPDYMLDDKGEIPEKHGQDLTDFVVKHGKTRIDLERLLPGSRSVNDEDQDFIGEYAFFSTGVTGRYGFQPRLLAERIMRDNELLFDPATSLLYRWNGIVWEQIDPAHLKRQAILYLGNESQRSRYTDAVDQIINLVTIPQGRQVNDCEGWICLKNGMFNIDTYELRPHGREFYATVMVPVDFDPEKPRACDRWLQFLGETIQTPQAIAQLQEFFGYCLTRETRYETCLIMIGDGADGKSTAQKVLRSMCGPENCTSISFDALEDQFQRVMLYQKMVNMSSEVGGRPMDSEYFKRIVSGDEITAAFKNKDGFPFRPFCKLVFAVNKMPKVLDTTDGLYRRILPIWFKRQFLPGDPARDPHLEEKLLAELDGIFAWSLLGLSNLRRRSTFDLDLEETRNLLDDYRRTNNPVCAFVQDALEPAPNTVADGMEKAELYSLYTSYCAKKGYGRLHEGHFWIELRREVKALLNSKLKNHRPRKDDGNRGNTVSGIAVKDAFKKNEHE